MASPSSHDKCNAQPETFKAQLDKAAVEQRERDQEPKQNPIVEKSKLECDAGNEWAHYVLICLVSEYIPAVGKVLAPKAQPRKEPAQVPGPPDRPHHDGKIEEFVRDQHTSKMPGGDLDTIAQDSR
jgi:hypothetical protein